MSELVRALRQAPDWRDALEALGLFALVALAGALAVLAGAAPIRPDREFEPVSLAALGLFLVPALGEELAFRGWLRRGDWLAALASLLAFVFWHPFQTLTGSPFGSQDFLAPPVLALIATLGVACTVSRLRSGSVWPPAVIHWGAAVLWASLFSG
jgi:predicted Abi (CAAX) family protease